MSDLIQVKVDNQGRIVIPPSHRDRLGLSHGMILIVEEGTEDELCLRVQDEEPILVDKEGILVVRASPLQDLTHIVHHERDRRLSGLVAQADL